MEQTHPRLSQRADIVVIFVWKEQFYVIVGECRATEGGGALIRIQVGTF